MHGESQISAAERNLANLMSVPLYEMLANDEGPRSLESANSQSAATTLSEQPLAS
jgi:hypothetical protein